MPPKAKVCPNGCGIPYKFELGHLDYDYKMTDDELACLEHIKKKKEKETK